MPSKLVYKFEVIQAQKVLKKLCSLNYALLLEFMLHQVPTKRPVLNIHNMRSTYHVKCNYNPYIFYLQRCRLSSAVVLWSARYGNWASFFLFIFLLIFLHLLSFLRDNTHNPLLSKAAKKNNRQNPQSIIIYVKT